MYALNCGHCWWTISPKNSASASRTPSWRVGVAARMREQRAVLARLLLCQMASAGYMVGCQRAQRLQRDAAASPPRKGAAGGLGARGSKPQRESADDARRFARTLRPGLSSACRRGYVQNQATDGKTSVIDRVS